MRQLLNCKRAAPVEGVASVDGVAPVAGASPEEGATPVGSRGSVCRRGSPCRRGSSGQSCGGCVITVIMIYGCVSTCVCAERKWRT